MNNFYNDLNFGKKYELEFAEMTKQQYIQSEGLEYWDLQITYKDIKLLYEIKADRLINKTGNIAVEFEYNYKPSGINNSKVDYWVFMEIDDNKIMNMWVIPTQELKDMCNNNKIPKKIKYDNKELLSKMYIINKSYFQKYKINNYLNDWFIYKEDTKEYDIDELEFILSSG